MTGDPVEISALPAADAANDTDRIPASQGATTRYLTPPQILARLTSVAWGIITGKPTTIAGYGISDAASTADLASKADLSLLSSYLLTTDLTWTNLSGKPSTFAPSAHAISHKHGGSDEIATATPAANAIPKANGSGWLDSWLSTAIARLTDLTWATISGKPSTFTPAAHAASHQNGGADEVGTATPAANAIPKASGSGWLDSWLSTAIARVVDITWTNLTGKPSTFAPSAHATSHVGGGSDAIATATTSISGLLSNADKTKLDGVATGATANIGTVTSVAMTMPGLLFNTSVPGSPIAGAGTLAPTLATQSANTVLAGPTTGAAATPTMRALVPADLPAASGSAAGSLSAAMYALITALTTEQTLTDGTSINVDLSLGTVCSVTLGGNRTLANPTNTTGILSFVVHAIQDGTGSRTLAYGANYKWAGGVAPTLSPSAGAIDTITFVRRGSTWEGAILKAYS